MLFEAKVKWIFGKGTDIVRKTASRSHRAQAGRALKAVLGGLHKGAGKHEVIQFLHVRVGDIFIGPFPPFFAFV